MHPHINREVKCAFRWYHRANLRYRYRQGANNTDHPDNCRVALAFPAYKLLPWQALAPEGVTVDTWVIKDIDGAQVFDLASRIASLSLATYANPSRTIICQETAIVDLTLPTGAYYEMEIGLSDGSVLYSETFEALKACTGASMTGDDLPKGFENWSFDSYVGLVEDVVPTNSDLPTTGMASGNQYLVLRDNLIYTWNGASYDSAAPSSGSYWTMGPGETWYRYNGSVFVVDALGPIAMSEGNACWQGTAAVPLVFTPPAGTLPTIADLEFTIFWGTPITGSLVLWLNGAPVATYTEADNGDVQTMRVLLNAGTSIEFRPTADFTGCLQRPRFTAVDDGSACLICLEWWDCGDIGTVAYTIGNGQFTNILYLREQGGCGILGSIGDPTPAVEDGGEEDARGETVPVKRRKQVDWRIEMAALPWHVVDALSEMTITASRELKAPWGDAADEVLEARMEVSWTDRMRLATGTLTVRCDDATMATGCCALFDQPCPDPCGDADGVFGVDELVQGDTYLIDGGAMGIYCGMECDDPVDENGFNGITACPSGYATVTRSGVQDLMRWDGSAWVTAVSIISLEATASPTAVVAYGSIPSGFTGRYEYSVNGTTWVAASPVLTAAEINDDAGISIGMDALAMYVRLVAYGYECELWTTAAVPHPSNCPHIVFSSNIDELCGSLPQDITYLIQPYVEDGGASLEMVANGEVVAIQWRVNGGSWTSATVQTTGSFYAITGIAYTTPGDLIEVRVQFTDRPECDDQVSQEFGCPE